MAGLDALTAMIYHERQARGSRLCAQHALNSLLQGNYFTAPDLASIAQSFDALEQGTLDEESRHENSMNMDDTGFFSVQVMDKALEVWGLNLVRWRSEQMRPYQASPHIQLAFVLNLHQHWFTLRRFGPAVPNPADDPGEGHWFNLNSAFNAPKWVSRTYLGMFLQQCETEGYSVFAVVQADPSKPLALPRTEADALATTVEAPDSAPQDPSTSRSPIPGSFPEDADIVIPEDKDYDIDEEDVELQAALQASITGGEVAFGHQAYTPRQPVPEPPLGQAHERIDVDDENQLPQTGPADPIAASLARQRAMLEHMRRAQEAALRETYEEEEQNFSRPQRRRTEQEEEDEAVRRAIAASMGEHEAAFSRVDDDDEDPEWRPEEDEGNEENVPVRRPPRQRQHAGERYFTPPSGDATPGIVDHRVYDDEDAQLQAALRASLETMPEGYVRPETPPLVRSSVPDPSSSALSSSSAALAPVLSPTKTDDDDDGEYERLSSPPPVQQSVDVDEMRRRRLARFGGHP